MDPDTLFGDQPSYLVSVLLDDHDERPSLDDGEELNKLWRLLILEDSGEFLTMDAKERTGQALSRFLNVVDGLIGQGLRILVLVTSNEELGKLHFSWATRISSPQWTPVPCWAISAVGLRPCQDPFGSALHN